MGSKEPEKEVVLTRVAEGTFPVDLTLKQRTGLWHEFVARTTCLTASSREIIPCVVDDLIQEFPLKARIWSPTLRPLSAAEEPSSTPETKTPKSWLTPPLKVIPKPMSRFTSNSMTLLESVLEPKEGGGEVVLPRKSIHSYLLLFPVSSAEVFLWEGCCLWDADLWRTDVKGAGGAVGGSFGAKDRSAAEDCCCSSSAVFDCLFLKILESLLVEVFLVNFASKPNMDMMMLDLNLLFKTQTWLANVIDWSMQQNNKRQRRSLTSWVGSSYFAGKIIR